MSGLVPAATRPDGHVERDGQVRCWWETTPVNLFANTTAFHAQAAAGKNIKHDISLAVSRIPDFIARADAALYAAKASGRNAVMQARG